MSDFGDSPDPQIIQLRDLLREAIDKQIYSDLSRPQAVADLQLILALAERLIEQYPVLTEAAS